MPSAKRVHQGTSEDFEKVVVLSKSRRALEEEIFLRISQKNTVLDAYACVTKLELFSTLLQQFVPAAKELEEQGLTEFQPHYLTHLCPEVYATTHECKTQCIHKGGSARFPP